MLKIELIFYISKSFYKFFPKEFQILENNFEIFVKSSVWRYVEPIQGVYEKIGFRMKSNRNTESCEKWAGWGIKRIGKFYLFEICFEKKLQLVGFLEILSVLVIFDEYCLYYIYNIRCDRTIFQFPCQLSLFTG